VFYVADHTSENWHVVLHGKKEANNEHEQANEICEIESFTSTIINKDFDDIIDDVHATRKDHYEGVYLCTIYCKFLLLLIIVITFIYK